MIEYLVDTNIFIHILKGNAELASLVDGLNCAIDTTVYVELIQGSKNKADVEKIELALTEYKLIHFSEDISRRTIALIRTYSKSHGLLYADAVIAATCVENDLTLLTLNNRDFRFIKGIKTREAKL